MSSSPSGSVVVDASVAIELLMRSSKGQAARAAIEGLRMFAPDLLNAEVVSWLRRKRAAGAIGERRSEQIVTDLARMPVERVRTTPLLHDIWRLRANLSAYDASYAALARRLACPLVTADARIAAAPGTGITVVKV